MQKNQPQSFHEDFKVGKAFDRGLMGRLLRYALPHKHLIILALQIVETRFRAVLELEIALPWV